jgi:ubiquinone/menaquinone biosynthesis C-methylase UbiE
MHNQTVSKMLVLLLTICCLVPLAALAAVLYLAAPAWLVTLVGLLALVLLARRLMRMLAPDDGRRPVRSQIVSKQGIGTMAPGTKYIPALRFGWLTPVYDPVLRRLLPETALKQRLIVQAQIGAGQRVLDLGAGTGTLTVMIKQAYPDADVVGLDGDLAVLALARQKAAAAGVVIRFDHGLATALPYGDAAFDRVLSSLMLHHLTTEDKGRALREAWRVLRPGGELHVLDFGPPQNALAWLISLVFRRLEQTADNIAGRLPALFQEAGFTAAAQTGQHTTLFGTLAFYRAQRQGTPTPPPPFGG